MKLADAIALSPELRRLVYSGAELEYLSPARGESEQSRALVLSTSDPYPSVVGHYLGLADPGDRSSESASVAGDEFELVGRQYRVHITGGARTTIVVVLGSGKYERPPMPCSPPQPGECAEGADSRAGVTAGNLGVRGGATNPLDPTKAR
jgi:hypothetical protein